MNEVLVLYTSDQSTGGETFELSYNVPPPIPPPVPVMGVVGRTIDNDYTAMEGM